MSCAGAAALVSLPLLALLLLHLLEPPLSITWSYAHLARHPALPWLGLALSLALPVAAALASRAWRKLPPWRPGAARAAAGIVALWAVLVAAGFVWPAQPLTLDSGYVVNTVAGRNPPLHRCYLAVETLGLVWRLLAPSGLGVRKVVTIANALLAAVGLAALAGCARELGRDRYEATLIALLSWTAFGISQIAIGYLDVYPFVFAVVALFLWLALGSLAGHTHPAWPVALAAFSPFAYFSLVLLAPAALWVLIVAARRPGGVRRTVVALLAAVLVAGLATLPVRGLPFDWLAFHGLAQESSAYQAGYDPESPFLPAWYLFDRRHLWEVMHTFLLIDPVGLVAIAAGTVLLALRADVRLLDSPTVLLLLFVCPFAAYVFCVDAVFGAFGEWDFASFVSTGTSLLGAYLLVRLGRSCPRHMAPVVGLALAVACVHLLARLGALHLEVTRHRLESPPHILAPAAGAAGQATSAESTPAAEVTAPSAAPAVPEHGPRR